MLIFKLLAFHSKSGPINPFPYYSSFIKVRLFIQYIVAIFVFPDTHPITIIRSKISIKILVIKYLKTLLIQDFPVIRRVMKWELKSNALTYSIPLWAREDKDSKISALQIFTCVVHLY